LAGVTAAPLPAAIADRVTAAERSARSLAAVVLEGESALTWLVPRFFGSPLTETIGPLNFLNFNESVGYVGLGTLSLTVVSVRLARRPGWMALALMTAAALGLAYGIPLLTELRRAPGLAHAANTRFIFMAAFGLTCLGALGLEACLDRANRWPRLLAIGLLIVTGLVAGLLAAAPDQVMPTGDAADPLTPLVAALWRQAELRQAAALAAGWAVALGAGWFLRSHPMAPAAMALPLVMLAVDLFHFGNGYNPTVASQVHRTPPAAVAFILSQDPAPRMVGLGEALLPNTATLYGVSDFRVYEPVAQRRLHPFFELLDPSLRDDIRSRFYLFIWRPRIDLLSLAGVRWLLVPQHDSRVATPDELQDAGLILRYQDVASAVWENPAARPRVYLAERVVAAREDDAALAGLGRVAASHSAAVAEWEVEYAAGRVTEAPPLQSRFEPGRTEVRIGGGGGGLLVVNDALYPGWAATLDGVPVSIVRTNVLFMGVLLPPGQHTLVLEYRPPALALGAAMSVAGLVALVLLIAISRRYRAG